MSDDNSEPGVPTTAQVAEKADQVTAKAEHVTESVVHVADKAAERVTSKAVEVPGNALSALKAVDKIILRLNKLIGTPGGLSSFLSTLNYTLYILAYLHTKSPEISSFARKLVGLLKSQVSKPATTTLIVDGAVPAIATLAGILSRTRTTLRLFGLFPLYTWLRTLLAGPKVGTDPVLHRIALLQASSYFTYQALENISFLADNGIVSTKVISFLNRGDSTTARVYLWAYRAWLGGVSCDLLRLAREAQLEGKRRATRQKMRDEGRAVAVYQDEEDAKVDAKWWTDLMIASAWLPMAMHFSSATGGLPGWNLGWMGVCGLVAGSTRSKALWESTLHP
ncbi:hypothetical protein K504DRAFT_395156 [Pleomassaria siparia CBS 279.74]|uniref:Peroxin 11C n=1 Tax=Pleomassaria siparia CBS 279.74 TaxID=1314801 RepID=A0A6G1KP49_9PLEO|nr:hypothetical protein K504DRAFT_395156 [Pleomassaria siparia CBS 279.74]